MSSRERGGYTPTEQGKWVGWIASHPVTYLGLRSADHKRVFSRIKGVEEVAAGASTKEDAQFLKDTLTPDRLHDERHYWRNQRKEMVVREGHK